VDSDCSDYSVTLDEIPAESVIFSHRSLPQMCKTANRVGKGRKAGLGGEKETRSKEMNKGENVDNENEEDKNGQNNENTDFEENHFR
jgi:Sec-independent protein translocase protein TatA